MPPLSVRPPTPVSEIRPPGVARPWSLRRGVHVAPGGATLHPGTAPLRIHPHAAHARQVDHQAGLADGVPRDVVAAATDRDRQPPCARANATAATTSAVPLARTMTAGRRSIMAFQTARAAS